jgi:orotate phosphoribosyltransferase
VRGKAKEYGTANRLEGVFEPGERVLLVEDLVTSGGAALDAVFAMREAGLTVENALCVLDRDEGGNEALAAIRVTLHPLFGRADLGLDSA